jgi:hypothetical protein
LALARSNEIGGAIKKSASAAVPFSFYFLWASDNIFPPSNYQLS